MIAGQGTIGLELAEQAPDAETVLIPIGGGGLAAGIALALRERRPRRSDRRRRLPAGLHDRGRHRGEASRRARVLDPRARARRHRLRLGRGDLRGARPLRRADEAPRRGRRALSGSPRCSPVACRRLRPGRGRPLGREHRRDDAHLRLAPRPDAGGPLPRRPHAHPGPARASCGACSTSSRAAAATSSPSTTTARGRTTSALQTEIELVVSTRDEEHCEELLAALRSPGYAVERLGPPS